MREWGYFSRVLWEKFHYPNLDGKETLTFSRGPAWALSSESGAERVGKRERRWEIKPVWKVRQAAGAWRQEKAARS